MPKCAFEDGAKGVKAEVRQSETIDASTSDLNEPMPDRVMDELDQRAGSQLSHHAGPMRFNRPDADVTDGRNILVGFAFGQQPDNFDFSRRQFDTLRGWFPTGNLGSPSRNFGRETSCVRDSATSIGKGENAFKPATHRRSLGRFSRNTQVRQRPPGRQNGFPKRHEGLSERAENARHGAIQVRDDGQVVHLGQALVQSLVPQPAITDDNANLCATERGKQIPAIQVSN
jgi:hypothetical protein